MGDNTNQTSFYAEMVANIIGIYQYISLLHAGHECTVYNIWSLGMSTRYTIYRNVVKGEYRFCILLIQIMYTVDIDSVYG